MIDKHLEKLLKNLTAAEVLELLKSPEAIKGLEDTAKADKQEKFVAVDKRKISSRVFHNGCNFVVTVRKDGEKERFSNSEAFEVLRSAAKLLKD